MIPNTQTDRNDKEEHIEWMLSMEKKIKSSESMNCTSV